MGNASSPTQTCTSAKLCPMAPPLPTETEPPAHAMAPPALNVPPASGDMRSMSAMMSSMLTGSSMMQSSGPTATWNRTGPMQGGPQQLASVPEQGGMGQQMASMTQGLFGSKNAAAQNQAMMASMGRVPMAMDSQQRVQSPGEVNPLASVMSSVLGLGDPFATTKSGAPMASTAGSTRYSPQAFVDPTVSGPSFSAVGLGPGIGGDATFGGPPMIPAKGADQRRPLCCCC
mmetsp:Transcript_66965/g.195771  ORF Transcript_66965/g.195771 Transcript_66965/m.195771 type:complete len:230 (-) Transcript_66965:90-779(-)